MMLGEKIKKYRIENNISQEDLANKLFVSRQARELLESLCDIK